MKWFFTKKGENKESRLWYFAEKWVKKNEIKEKEYFQVSMYNSIHEFARTTRATPEHTRGVGGMPYWPTHTTAVSWAKHEFKWESEKNEQKLSQLNNKCIILCTHCIYTKGETPHLRNSHQEAFDYSKTISHTHLTIISIASIYKLVTRPYNVQRRKATRHRQDRAKENAV